MPNDQLINYFGQKIFNDLSEFFKEESLEILVDNNISLHNTNIIVLYLKDIRRKVSSPVTLKNNSIFFTFLLPRFQKDLDQITEQDRDDILDMIDDWITLRGKPAKDSSKKQYKIALKRFLSHFGEKTRNNDLIALADFKIPNSKAAHKLPDDILTEEDIRKMIECAEGVRNKALIAVLYESGARRGELENCKLKDVNEFHRGKEHGYVMKLRGKTGERQVTIYRYQQWLRIWLEACNNNDPETPLFPTTRRYSEPHDYGHLKGDRFNSILKAAAKKAGIKKNIHAHLLRHSQATRLANTMTEQQLKTQFGWQPGSNMTSVYVHLSGRDTQNAMLKSYGIVTEEDEKGNKVEHCGQCDEIISPGMNHCPRCGKPITQEGKDKSDNMQMLISTLLSDPEILKQFSEVLNNLNQG